MLTDGRWLLDGRFEARTMYVAGGLFVDSAAAGHVTSSIDLGGRFVVPPFAEAHNHNIEASPRLDSLLARYLSDGIFYVENPNVLPRARAALLGKVNVPQGVDVLFANGGLTGTGGHPMDLARRNVARGIWRDSDTEGAFFWAIDSIADLVRKWPAILSQHPDFIKLYLLHSEEYQRRKADDAFLGWRGLDPAVVSSVVTRAHTAGLRVAAHVETAHDFDVAIAAGVDQIAHTPGFRGERGQLPDPAAYRITRESAMKASRQGTTVVTTLAGIAGVDLHGPDSSRRKAFDALHRANLTTLKDAGVQVLLGSDNYSGDGKDEAAYLQSLGVFSNAELLVLWTETTPRAIFPARRIGILQPGYEASFLVLSCDPVQHFQCVDSLTIRYKSGAPVGETRGAASR
ncbi:MAG: hypothetical protein JWM95_4548 [Gemmatimonadetes bacterium]|nr:hypothetical protein [Gemmatimonadota bacterium]